MVSAVGFNHNVENVVQVVEGIGVAILVLGGLLVLIHSGVLYLIPARRARAYHYFRKHLGRVILLGLEVLIIADIIRTVIVDQSCRECGGARHHRPGQDCAQLVTRD